MNRPAHNTRRTPPWIEESRSVPDNRDVPQVQRVVEAVVPGRRRDPLLAVIEGLSRHLLACIEASSTENGNETQAQVFLPVDRVF